jgi:carbon-monoxide dehydrogenase medium subunit
LVAYGTGGEREIPSSGFFFGPGRTALAEDEFLTAVRYPVLPRRSAGRYVKLGRNRAGDLALVGVAVFGCQDESVSSGFRFRIGLASVAPVPLRVTEAERILEANEPDERAFVLAAEEAMRAATPIADVRAGVEYQRAMVRTLTLRGLRAVWAELLGS